MDIKKAAKQGNKQVVLHTVMCLSIGTPENNKFSIVPNGKLIIFRCPKIWVNYSLTIIGLNIGTPKNH